MNGKHIKVLLIEDNPGDVKLTHEMLLEDNRFSFELVHASVLSKGVEHLKENSIDIVLLDLGLPDSQGIDTLHVILSMAPRIPIIVQTGLSDEDIAIRAVKAGAQDYMIKGQMNSALLCRSILYSIERKIAEDALKQSEMQYRLLADNMKDQVWLLDMNLSPTYVSPSVERSLGYTFEEIMKLPMKKLLTATSFQSAMNFFTMEMPKALADQSYAAKNSLELEFCAKDGSTLWLEFQFSLIWDDSKPLSILCIGRDITERRQAEEKLRLEEQMFRTLTEQSSDIVVLIDNEGTITYENPAIEKALGVKPEERIGHSIFERIHPDDLMIATNAVNISFGDINVPIQRAEVRLQHKDGSWHTFDAVGSILTHGTVITGGLINLHDITERKLAEERTRKALMATVEAFTTTVETRDPYTAGHQRRVADLARAIAEELNLPVNIVDGIRMAASIHDLGKISVPAEILIKPAKLTDIEFSLIKIHPKSGYDILKDIDFPWPVARIVLEHHERINGSGYPNGLVSEETLLESRIIAVADVVESMASHRPYRPALGIEAALEEIEKNRETLYDNAVVDACLRLFKERNYQLKSI
ncbi:MAG: hypothetical protein APR62_05345 [Smithella sp. SDB]|nr:MAG: hypothetical protein APR62_05345 [Smithella sp. SDB]